MTAFLVTFAAMANLVIALGALFKKPEARALLLWMISLFVIGTVFYHLVEGWSWLDSFYFCVITLSTVGYGDLDPTTSTSKIFTVIYIFIGLSIFVSFVNMLAKQRAEIHSHRTGKRSKKSQGSDASA